MKLSNAAAIIAFSAQSLSSPAVVMAGSGKTKTGKKSKALAKTNAANSYSSSMSIDIDTNPPTSRPTDAPTTAPPNCRDDLYAFKFDEQETTFSDDGLTGRTFMPLYGYGDDGLPDFSTVVGEYNSVNSIIPAGVGFGAETGFTCQQQAMIGLNLVGEGPAFYEDQLSGSGICFSTGPGSGPFSVLEGSSAATGGIGIYGGASGRIDYQCYSETECTIRVRVCVSKEHLL